MSPNRRWSKAGEEPDIAEILADPVVHAVVRRDSVSMAQLRGVIARAQAALQVGFCRCAA